MGYFKMVHDDIDWDVTLWYIGSASLLSWKVTLSITYMSNFANVHELQAIHGKERNITQVDRKNMSNVLMGQMLYTSKGLNLRNRK